MGGRTQVRRGKNSPGACAAVRRRTPPPFSGEVSFSGYRLPFDDPRPYPDSFRRAERNGDLRSIKFNFDKTGMVPIARGSR